MKKLLALTLTALMLTTSIVSAETIVSDLDTIEKYGVQVDSSMIMYEGLEEGLYKVDIKEGYEGEIGSAASYQDEDNYELKIFGIGGSGYLTLTDKDSKVVAQNVILTRVETIEENLNNTVEDGVYVLGKTIEKGLYKAEIIETEGYGVGLIVSTGSLDLDTADLVNKVKTVDVGEIIEFEITEEDYVSNLELLKDELNIYENEDELRYLN